MESNTAPALDLPSGAAFSTPLHQVPHSVHAASHPPAHAGHVAHHTESRQPLPPDTNTASTTSAAAVTATQAATSAPAITADFVDPIEGLTADNAVDHPAETPARVDTEAEARLTSEISTLWGVQKNGKTAVRRTRAELKALRLVLAEKLHAMKAILVGTGREGRWVPYVRSQGIPLASADRHVAEHEASLAPPKEKLLTEELPADEVRKLARKMLPKLCCVLTTQELVYEFIHELISNVDVARVTETEEGMMIPKNTRVALVEVSELA